MNSRICVDKLHFMLLYVLIQFPIYGIQSAHMYIKMIRFCLRPPRVHFALNAVALKNGAILSRGGSPFHDIYKYYCVYTLYSMTVCVFCTIYISTI